MQLRGEARSNARLGHDFGRQPNLKQLAKSTGVKRTMKHETSEWKGRFHAGISVSMLSCEGTDLGSFFVGL